MKFKETVSRNIREAGHFFSTVFRQSMRDNILNSASGLVYSTLLAIVPALTFLFTLFNALGVLEPLVEFLSQWFTDLAGPDAGSQLMEMLTNFTRNATSLGVVGLISFLVTMVRWSTRPGRSSTESIDRAEATTLRGALQGSSPSSLSPAFCWLPM